MRRRFFRRKRRRTVWVPGVNFGESVETAAITLTALGAGSSTTALTAALTNDEDLQEAGGAGAVVVRVVGRLQFHSLDRPTGTDTPGWIRVGLFTIQNDFANTAIRPPDLWTVAGMAQENILWMGQCWVPPDDMQLTATSPVIGAGFGNVLDVDAGSKRRLENDLALGVTIQSTVNAAGNAATSVDCTGYLRVLLQQHV